MSFRRRWMGLSVCEVPGARVESIYLYLFGTHGKQYKDFFVQKHIHVARDCRLSKVLHHLILVLHGVKVTIVEGLE